MKGLTIIVTQNQRLEKTRFFTVIFIVMQHKFNIVTSSSKLLYLIVQMIEKYSTT